jgi:quercetin dioxygenase-like cupin family protein
MKLQHFKGADFFNKTGLPLCIERTAWHESTPMHSHDFSELVLVFHGSATHETKDDNYRISTGDVFVIDKNEAHGYKDDEEEFSVINTMFRTPDLGENHLIPVCK